MPRKKPHYKEGDWFAVPLEGDGYALGLIARQKQSGIFGYFFGPRHSDLPTLEDAAQLGPADAMQRLIFGDLDLLDGRWPVLGALPHWERSAWPMPDFVHKDPISGRLYLRTYDENTLDFLSQRRASNDEASNLPEDGSFGAGAVVTRISRLIREAEKPQRVLEDSSQSPQSAW